MVLVVSVTTMRENTGKNSTHAFVFVICCDELLSNHDWPSLLLPSVARVIDSDTVLPALRVQVRHHRAPSK